jgi:5-methylcytosine-specific restriction endonuclease McrA
MSRIRRSAADAKFSLIIRERDKWTCQRCGSKHEPGSRGLHAAHCFTRRTAPTRHNPSNSMALCYGCHQFVDSHPEEKYALFRKKLGDQEYDALVLRAHLTSKRQKSTVVR